MVSEGESGYWKLISFIGIEEISEMIGRTRGEAMICFSPETTEGTYSCI